MLCPNSRIFICLWHVCKAWAENAVKKVSTVGKHTIVFHLIANIMYTKIGFFAIGVLDTSFAHTCKPSLVTPDTPLDIGWL